MLPGLEAAANGGDAQRHGGKVGCRECREWHQSGGTGNKGDDELVEVVQDRPARNSASGPKSD
jgi:hypothetical protein